MLSLKKTENGFTFLGLVSMVDPPRVESERGRIGCQAGRNPPGYDYRRP